MVTLAFPAFSERFQGHLPVSTHQVYLWGWHNLREVAENSQGHEETPGSWYLFLGEISTQGLRPGLRPYLGNEEENPQSPFQL